MNKFTSPNICAWQVSTGKEGQLPFVSMERQTVAYY
jgi:hypothetical protein